MNYKIILFIHVKIMDGLVRSRLYSCQAWTLTKREANYANVGYVLMLRKIVKDIFV